jgi:hypothetical protein
MIVNWIGGLLERSLRAVWSAAERYWAQMTKPDRDSLLVGSLADMTRSRTALIAENALLRQQPHQRLTRRDRVLMVLLASKMRAGKMPCYWSNRTRC